VDYKLNVIDKCKQEVEFDVPYEKLTPHFEKALQKFREKATIPGFRKGKAPVSMLKKMYGSAIEYDSLEDVANNIFIEYIETNNVKLLGKARLQDINYTPETNLTFKIQYEIKPDFEITQYKGLEITKNIYEIDNKLIEDEINNLRAEYCIYQDSQKAENNEYVVTLDIQQLDDTGLPIIGHVDKDIKIYLNDKHANRDLKEQLSGITLGEERILMLKDEKQNKILKYRAKSIKIEKIILPALDKEFFDKLHKHDISNEEEFRHEIKKDLEMVYNNISLREIENNIISELIKLNEIPVPDTMVENILDSYIEEIKNRNQKRELPQDFNVEEYRKTKRVDAIRQVKWFLAKEKIISAENITVTREDIEPLIESDSKKYNLPQDKLRSIYEKNDDVKYRILDNKLMKFLIDSAKITEVNQSPNKN
jgi:trigger factor